MLAEVGGKVRKEKEQVDRTQAWAWCQKSLPVSEGARKCIGGSPEHHMCFDILQVLHVCLTYLGEYKTFQGGRLFEWLAPSNILCEPGNDF